MANRVSIGTGNFLTAGTWGLIDTTSYLNSETGNSVCPTASGASARSAAFTPGAITIQGIAVKLSIRNGSTGIVTIRLWNNTDSVAVAGTTIAPNVSDLLAATNAAQDGGWVVTNFANVLLVAGKAYMVEVFTGSAAQVTLFTNGTANNWSRMLITSTTGAPAAGDDLVVAGNYTGAGTSNSFTVTMDETAATDYGSNTTSTVTPSLAICAKGTLKWKDTSAANPYLRQSGHVIVYNGGTLQIGSSGTAIPRDSVAVLEFDCLADGDFGLVWRDGATVNIYGLSRTSGKNVVSTKLNADFAGGLITAGANGTSMGLATATGSALGSLAGVSGDAISRLAAGVTDTAANAVHMVGSAATGSVTNTTQVATVYLARGSGTNNRFVRIQYGSSATAAITNGFFADVDLQAGTIGTCTAAGNGTGTSSAITAFGGGFICTIIGKASSGALSPFLSLMACNASTVTSYAGDATQNFLFYGPQVYTAASLQSPTLTVVDDTGWLSGDMYAVASTDRTSTNCEPGVLGSDATATTLPAKQNLLVAHSGTSPTQAEIILITRNVKVRAVNSTFMAFATGNLPNGGEVGTAAVHIEWAEFYYVGVNAAGKRSVEIGSSSSSMTGSFSLTFCSIHDTEINGFYVGSNAANVTFSNNTMWKLADTTGPGAQIAIAITATSWTFDSNILLRTANGTGWTLNDVGGTFTNNVVAGAASIGISLTEQINNTAGLAGVIGTMSGNVAHSNVTNGFQFSGSGCAGTFGTPIAWRNNSAGLSISSGVSDLVFSSLVAFGNNTNNIVFSTPGAAVKFTSPVINGDTSFATTNGIQFSVSGSHYVVITDGDFSTVAGIKTAHTNDINPSALGSADVRMLMYNTKLGGATEVTNSSNLSSSAYISSEKHDQTAGLHKTWTRYGATTTTLSAIVSDTVIFNNASPSERVIPNSSTNKTESAPVGGFGIKYSVANGQTLMPFVYVRKSQAGDAGGVNYAGNQPRLILRANPAIGIASDTVIATMSVGNGTWERLSGTTAAATDDGVMEFIVDCDGTSGAWINIDDWGGAQAADPNWFNGLPGDRVPIGPIAKIASFQRGTPY